MREPQMLESLLRGGIGPRRARRLIEEFEAHHADVCAERIAFGEPPDEAARQAARRLGSPEDFIARLLARPELKSWAWRLPWLAFALLPMLGLGAVLLLSVLGIMGAGHLIGACYGSFDAHLAPARWLARAAPICLCWLAPAAVASVLAHWAAARRVFSLWPWVGIALIALLGAHTNFDVPLPPQVPEAYYHGGFGVSTAPSPEVWQRLLLTWLSGALLFEALRRRRAA